MYTQESSDVVQQPQQQPPPQQVQYNQAPQAQPYVAPQSDLAYPQQPQEQMPHVQAQPPPQQQQLSVDAAQQQGAVSSHPH